MRVVTYRRNHETGRPQVTGSHCFIKDERRAMEIGWDELLRCVHGWSVAVFAGDALLEGEVLWAASSIQ